MKKSVLAVALSSAWLLLPQSQAQTPAGAPAAPAPSAPLVTLVNSDAMQTLVAASQELQGVAPDELNVNKKLDAYSKFNYSPQLRPRLLEMFGTERPMLFERAPSPKGKHNFVARLPAHSYLQRDGGVVTWSDGVFNVSTNPAGNKFSGSGTLSVVTMAGNFGKLTFQGISAETRQTRGPGNLWFGTSSGRIARTASSPDAPVAFVLEDQRIESAIRQHGKNADISYGISIKAVTVADQRVDRVNIALRMVNLDIPALQEFSTLAHQPSFQQLAPEARQVVTMARLKDMAKSMIKGGASLVFDDISAAYHGNTVSLKGRLGFDPVSDADFASADGIVKKLVLRLDLRLPVALVNEVSRAFAAKRVDASAPNAAEQIAAITKGMTAGLIDANVKQGYANIEQGELRSVIEFKNGKLTFNGKTTPLFTGTPAPAGTRMPVAPAAPKAPPAPPAPPAPAIK